MNEQRRIDRFLTLSLTEWSHEVHALAIEKGWYECRHCLGAPMSVRGGCNACGNKGMHRNPGELIALIHSELSEALEELRNGNALNSPEVGEELADALIRILDMCAYAGIDIANAVAKKHETNRERPIKHGKVF